MTAIFISHSSKDDAFAGVLMARLAEQGHRSVFLDFDPENGIPAGRHWEKELYARLRACQVMIVLCSEPAMASQWCFAEIVQARSLGKPVFPLKISPCRIPPILSDLQITDFTVDAADGFQRLWSGLRRSGLDPADLFDWDGTRPPYPGLLAFQEKDAAIYFGRDAAIHQAMETLNRLQRLGGARLALMLGASGSGKSSLARAGIIPRLKRDRDHWLVLDPFRPLGRPFDELAMVLAGAFGRVGPARDWKTIRDALDPAAEHPDGTRLIEMANDLRTLGDSREAGILLVIDQFEELLNPNAGSSATRFLRLLRAISSRSDTPFLTLGTLRSDFLGAFQAHDVAGGLTYEPILLPQMEVSDFVQVIEGPARVAGHELEAGLAQVMVEDTATDDALPLLAFALRELWDRHGSDGQLTLEEYRDRLGGLQGSLARAAEAIFAERTLSPEEERHLRKAFLSMVRVDQDGRYARWPARWADLPPDTHDRLERFVQARLLVSRSEGTDRILEVAHEALFRSWDRLAGWLNLDREFLLWRQRLQNDAKEWEAAQRDDDALLRGAVLAEAGRRVAERDEDLSAAERDFIQASLARRDRERAALERRRRRFVLASAGAAAFFFVLSGVAGWQWLRAENERQTADSQRRLALSRQLASQATTLLIDDKLDGALLFSLRAFQTDSNFDTRDSLLNALERSPRLVAILRGHGPGLNAPSVHDIAFHPDGRILASAGEDRRVVLWDVATGRKLKEFIRHPDNAVTRLAFSPDGERLATLGVDGAWVWKLADGTKLAGLTGSTHELTSLAFSPDGKWLATGGCTKIANRKCAEGQVTLWDSQSGSPRFAPLAGHAGWVTDLVFQPDGERLASAGADGTVRLWNASTGAPDGDPIQAHVGAINALAFSPDGMLLATAGADSTVRVWKSASGQPQGAPLTGHEGAVISVAFSRDGTLLASAGDDRTTRIWQVDTGKPLGAPIRGHRDRVNKVAFSPSGQLLASASDDNTVILANAARSSPIGELLAQLKSGSTGLAFSPDGRLLASGGSTGEINVWDAAERKPYRHWVVAEGTRETRNASGAVTGWSQEHLFLESTAFHPNGKILASGSLEGLLELRDVGSGERLGKPMHHPGEIRQVAFSPDGKMLASVGSRGSVVLWSVDSQEQLATLKGHREEEPGVNAPFALDVFSVAFSPDGRLLATGSFDKTVILWDVASRKPVGGPLAGHAAWIDSIAFSPNGRIVASADVDGVIMLWDPATGRRLDRQMRMPLEGYTRIAFSPDGAKLAAVGAQRLVMLWDVASGDAIAHGFAGPLGQIESVAFSPDGKTVATGDFDGKVVLWNVSLDDWAAQACHEANRNLSEEEWARVAPGVPYERICRELPFPASVAEASLEKAKAAGKARLPEAPVLYKDAADQATGTEDPDLNNRVCWFGAIDGSSQTVLPACDRAVALAPLDGGWRDTRGIARALAGDRQGAVEDLQFFVRWAQADGKFQEYLPLRNGWIAELTAGRNPFDAPTLDKLRNEP